MARIRNIKPDFFMSEDIGALTVASRLLYVALFGHADRSGKMKFQRTALAAQTMPFEMDDFDKCLDELCEKGHVVYYEVEGSRYLYLPKLSFHQTFHKTEKKSIHPDQINGDDTYKPPLKTVKPPLKTCKGGEGEGEGNKERIDKSIPKKDTVKRKSRIPENWSLSENDRANAIAYWRKQNRSDLDPDDQAGKFISHHRAKGSMMVDWSSAWVTWYGNAVRFNDQPPESNLGFQP